MVSTKYIGLDVHKETISISVMNSAGKVVMECVIETKASTILQFIHGLSGDLYVTFEEGTWAGWLYDLLKAHVTKIVVCDPRRNALLKEGNKSDRIDARKLAELLRGNHLKPVYHGEHGLRTLKELARSYLTITKDLTRVMNRLKALYRRCSVYRQGSIRTTPPFGMVEQDHGNWRPPSRRTLLPATRCFAALAPGGTAGSVDREPETPVVETAPPDPGDRSDTGGSADRTDPDPSPIPHQATAVELQRSGDRDARQCGIPLRGRSATTFQETAAASWAQSKSQPRPQSDLQGCGHERQRGYGTVPRFL
jgi:Transposase